MDESTMPRQPRRTEPQAEQNAATLLDAAELDARQAEEGMTCVERCEKWEQEADAQTDNALDWQIYMDCCLTRHMRKTEPDTLHAIYRRAVPAPPELLEQLRKMAEGEKVAPLELPHPPQKGLQRHPAYIMRPYRKE